MSHLKTEIHNNKKVKNFTKYFIPELDRPLDNSAILDSALGPGSACSPSVTVQPRLQKDEPHFLVRLYDITCIKKRPNILY